METFYIVVLTVAIGLLILILTYIGVYVLGKPNDKPYPPVKNQCPDYWEIDESTQKCKVPDDSHKNAGNIYDSSNSNNIQLLLTVDNTPGITSDGAIDFEASDWNTDSSTARCYQKKWANSYNIIWDTVSNYNSC